MESEAGGFGGLLLPQVALDEDILALLPSSAQALEGGATLDAKVGKALVEVPDRDLGGCLGRPRLGQSGGLGDMWSKDAGGVRGPLLRQVAVAMVLRASIDRDLALTSLVGLADRHLQLHGALLGHDEGGLHDQLPHLSGAGLLAGPQRQLEESGAGQKDDAVDGMVGQPGMGGEGEAAGEQKALTVSAGQPPRPSKQARPAIPLPSPPAVPRAL